MARKNCVECGEVGTDENPVALYRSKGAGNVKDVHAACGKRALEFATAGDVSEIVLRTWPTNRTDEELEVTGLEALAKFDAWIADKSDEEIANYGGVEGKLLQLIPGCVLPHLIAIEACPPPASVTYTEWWTLVQEARQSWHDLRANEALLRYYDGKEA